VLPNIAIPDASTRSLFFLQISIVLGQELVKAAYSIPVLMLSGSLGKFFAPSQFFKVMVSNIFSVPGFLLVIPSEYCNVCLVLVMKC
jgi:hypothetical protein